MIVIDMIVIGMIELFLLISFIIIIIGIAITICMIRLVRSITRGIMGDTCRRL